MIPKEWIKVGNKVKWVSKSNFCITRITKVENDICDRVTLSSNLFCRDTEFQCKIDSLVTDPRYTPFLEIEGFEL